MNTYQRIIEKERKAEKDEVKYKIIGVLIAVPICGWMFVWYNYVWIQWPIGYWKWTAFAALSMAAPKWLRVPVFGIIGTVAVFAQVAKWFDLIALPLIK